MIKLRYMPGRLLVGLSGGADSVALLLLLLEAGAEVSAVHVNHGLRAEASDGDEAFVRELCSIKQVPLKCFRASPTGNPSENWAREVRYGFFRQAMEECAADALVLAHHQDDQAETVLLHLLRGAGMAGLTGMAPESTVDGMRILRPLLKYSRADLRAYLQERNQSWRDDASNSDPRYLRNALRQEVLPRLEQLIPGASARMAATASILQEDHAALNVLAETFLGEHPGKALPLAALQEKPDGLQRRILRAWWVREAVPKGERCLSAGQTEALLALVESHASARCNLPGCWFGLRGWTHLHLVPPLYEQAIQEHPAAGSPLLELLPYTGDCGDGLCCQVIPKGFLEKCTIRTRRAGDFICPFGSTGGQSMQDYFVNRRIDAAFREKVPLLCRGSEVLLAGGVGAGRIPRSEEINEPVLLRWKDVFPWQRRK